MVVDKRTVLRRNKAIATGLLVAAAILFVLARYRGWAWVAAFAEAAMVGALADWFAVVALFKHPLRIPIPHTAIIPNKKHAIAESLAEFIQEKFLATEALVTKLRGWNPGGRLASYLTSRDNAESLASGISRLISNSVDFIDDERVRGIVGAAVNDRIEKADLSTAAAGLLDLLRKDNRHHAVLDDVLGRLARWLNLPESQAKLAAAIDKWCNDEYPLLVRFIPNREQFAKGAGEKVAKRLNAFIQEVNEDPAHELRQKFDTAVSELVGRLKEDPAVRDKVENIKKEIIGNPHLSEYIRSLLSDLKQWVRGDLDRPDSRIREKIVAVAVGVGTAISCSGDLRASINEHLENMIRNSADGLRSGFARHVSGTIKEWDDEEFVREIESSIGSDLQFIRMNGTLVGGMIGILIHAVRLVIG